MMELDVFSAAEALTSSMLHPAKKKPFVALCDALTGYTVILQYPLHTLPTQLTCVETYMTWVRTTSVTRAVDLAKAEASAASEIPASDFECLYVFRGRLTAETGEPDGQIIETANVEDDDGPN